MHRCGAAFTRMSAIERGLYKGWIFSPLRQEIQNMERVT